MDNDILDERLQDDLPAEVWLEYVRKENRQLRQELARIKKYASGLEEENVMQHKENKRLVKLLRVNSHIPLKLCQTKHWRGKYNLLMEYVRRLQNLLQKDGIPYPEISSNNDHPLDGVVIADLEQEFITAYNEAMGKDDK